MLKVIAVKKAKIYYECGCGVEGYVVIKPMVEAGAFVLNVTCPVCDATERITILQYDSEERKAEALANLDADELSWACILYNEITDYRIMEDLGDASVNE